MQKSVCVLCKYFLKRIFLFSLLLAAQTGGALQARTYELHAFRDYSSDLLQMELIGQVVSRSQMITDNRPRMLDYDTREMILSASLYGDLDVRIGDMVYVIQKDPDHERYKNGLIVAEARVFSVFKTEFQGLMIKASGNLSMVKKGHYIARMDFSSKRELALEYLKRGEKYHTLKDYQNAFFWYKKSLSIDDERPETYLNLAKLSESQGLHIQANTYIKGAWEKHAKVEDPNVMLELPSVYLRARLEEILTLGSEAAQLRHYLLLLQELRDYKSEMKNMRSEMDPVYQTMIDRRGIPDYNYQFGMGELYKQIYRILYNNPLNETLNWLEKKERDILLAEIPLLIRKEPFEYPSKSWENAYFEAAIYHYRLAVEINEMDPRANYEIIQICYEKLDRGVSQVDRERFVDYLDHYGRLYLRIPSASPRYSEVRSILNKYSQL